MGWLRRVGFALSGAAAWLGLGPDPETDEARAERIAEMYASYSKEFPDVPGLTPAELVALQASGQSVVVVDVRTDGERAVSTLPGAVPAATVEADPQAYRGVALVAYCTIGYRSGLWAKQMRAEGLAVSNLEGSVLAWTHAALPLVDPQGLDTASVHVYGPPWDLAAQAYDATW